VLSAFGLDASHAEALGDGARWRYGELVLHPVDDKARATFLARTLEHADVPSLRVAHPARSRDGRWIIAGWSAWRSVSGAPEPRPDDTILAAMKLHAATADLPWPEYLSGRDDPRARADRVAWQEDELSLDGAEGGGWFEVLSGSLREVHAQPQLVHGELFGSVLFDGAAPPGIDSFEPYFRPAGWAAAVVAVDAIAAEADDGSVLRRWAHLPEWPQMLLRAVLFRLALNAIDPEASTASMDGLRLAARQVSGALGAQPAARAAAG
jgi:uncharacterized protein (TIGR02569 family)